MSSTRRPRRLSAAWIADAGTVARYGVSAADSPYAIQVASGVRPRRSASSALISSTAAAPSLTPGAFPAVTVPSGWNSETVTHHAVDQGAVAEPVTEACSFN